ncbi:MAG: hypothetical protein II811_08110 [Spirochaetaceae bacterium]|nr:hypothetical protein [Spirochaetaceae bacterium]
MKKLVSAAVIAALVAGAANSEVSIKMNARVRGDLAEMSTSSEADNETVLFSNSSNDTDSVVSSGAADTLKLEAKNDYAGVNFAFSNDLSKGSTGVDSYSAWLLFGGLKFRGSYNVGNRTANRVTTDQNNVSLLEGNLTAAGRVSKGKNVGKSNESWSWVKGTLPNSGKLGINKNLAGVFGNDGASSPAQLVGAVGADIDNMDLNIEAGKALVWGLEYGLSDVLPGDLTLMAYLVESSGESVTKNDDGNTTTVLNSQYAFKADYNQKDLFRVTFDGKVAHQKMAFGLFFSPQMVENLALTVGGTFALDKTGYSLDDDTVVIDDDITYWGVDFRARYAISEAMAATFYANVSGASTKYSDEDASALALDFIGNFTYGLNDLVKLFVEGEYAAITLDSGDAEKNNVYTTKKSTYLISSSVTGQFGAILTAGKGATLTPALRLTVSGLGLDKDKTGYAQGMLISVPVVMRVQL